MGEVNFRSRKGVVIISQHIIAEAKEGVLKCLFSEFYPIATEVNHNPNYYGSVKFYGYSHNFRLVEEGEIAPEYEAIITQNPESYSIEFKEIIKGQIRP